MTDTALELFLRKWFCGPLNLCYRVREFGYVSGPLGGAGFRRGPYALEGFIMEFGKVAKMGFERLNAFLSIASYSDLEMSELIYDALHYDFDCGEDPSKALEVAAEWVRVLKEAYGCDAVVYSTGFKGVHVVIPLKQPTDWEGYRLTYHALLNLSRGARELNDWAMLQPNRLDRIPYTWNYKEVNGEPRRAYVRVVDLRAGKPVRPEEFDWANYEHLDLRDVEAVKVVVSVPKPRVVRAVGRHAGSWAWVEEVVRKGLPDGRRRFILYTLTPYLATVRRVSEEEGVETVKEFLEASCRNHGACGKVYDSWVRAALRGAARKGVKPRGLRSWGERDPEVLRLIKDVLNGEGRMVKITGLNPYAAKVLEFVRETGLEEFSYDDFKRWLEGREGRLLNASEWQGWERRLRELVSEGILGRKYLINGEWVDYGTKRVTTPPSKAVRFYVARVFSSHVL